MERISVEEFNKLKKKGNKYHANITEYNGRRYASRKEAEFSKQLDTLKSARNPANRVVRIVYQPEYVVWVKGIKVFKYIADFKVSYADGHETISDVKGSKNGAGYALFRLKKKCVEAQYGIKIEEV